MSDQTYLIECYENDRLPGSNLAEFEQILQACTDNTNVCKFDYSVAKRDCICKYKKYHIIE